jgi:hypothetical protein
MDTSVKAVGGIGVVSIGSRCGYSIRKARNGAPIIPCILIDVRLYE